MIPKVTLSRRLRALLADLSTQFAAYAETFGALTGRRADLAAPFMRAFTAYHRETGRTFVAFVAELDPALPTADKAYLRHPTYQAALYLRRLVDAPHTTTAHRRTASPFEMLAVVCHTAMPFIAPYDKAFWAAFQQASHWRPRDIARLQQRTTRAGVLALPHVPRLVARKSAA